MPNQKKKKFFSIQVTFIQLLKKSHKTTFDFSSKSVKVDCAQLLEHLIKYTEIHQCLAITDETLLKESNFSFLRIIKLQLEFTEVVHVMKKYPARMQCSLSVICLNCFTFNYRIYIFFSYFFFFSNSWQRTNLQILPFVLSLDEGSLTIDI